MIKSILKHLNIKENLKFYKIFGCFYDKKNKFYSQIGQDYYVLKYFNFKKDGFYIDIGAHDGVSLSNTKKLEELGWSGICVEPNPSNFKALEKNRTCKKLNVGIADENGVKDFVFSSSGGTTFLDGIKEDMASKHFERFKKEAAESNIKIETTQIQTITFDRLVQDLKNIQTIDYISIDTEGNEFKILKSINFSKYDIKVLTVENNFNDNKMRKFMAQNGYICLKIAFDDLYIKSV